MKKGLFYEVWPRNVHALTTWNSTNIETHGRKRRVLNYAFSEKALRSAEPFVVSNTDRWCEIIAEESRKNRTGWSESLNMADWVNYLVFDILGDLCFGKSFDMKEKDSDMKYVPHLMVDFLTLMYPVGLPQLSFFLSCKARISTDPRTDTIQIAYSPFASLWVWLKPRGLDKLISLAPPRALVNWGAFVEKCLSERTKTEEEARGPGEEGGSGGPAPRQDFFHYLYHAVDPQTGERGFPLDELYGECESLIIAGSDTTAVVLSALFFYLARRPAAQARLAREIDAAFPGGDATAEIRAGPALHACRYLRAVVQEALRMTPPVSAEPSREVLAGGTSVEVEGGGGGGVGGATTTTFLPAGVHVSTGLYCLSYSRDVFPRPFEFRPERWLAGEDGASAESVALAESGFCAFSHGSRGCPGKNLAWLEMSVVVAKVIYLFELRQDPSDLAGGGSPEGRAGRRNVEQYQTYDAFVSLRDGPMVQFRRRGRL